MEPFSSLVLCKDPGPLATVQKILEEYGFIIRAADSARSALDLIKGTKFDLGVYDADMPGALDLANTRSSIMTPNMIFALVRGDSLSQTVGKRVHFIMQKPFSADLFARTLRAAYGTMVRERRVSFRHPVQIRGASVVLVQDQGKQALHETVILDLSQTGMCVQTLEILSQGATLEIEFQLPDTRDTIHALGSVMWTRASGRTGVKFIQIAHSEQKSLTGWLDSRMPFPLDAIPKLAPPMRQDRLPEVRV